MEEHEARLHWGELQGGCEVADHWGPRSLTAYERTGDFKLKLALILIDENIEVLDTVLREDI